MDLTKKNDGTYLLVKLCKADTKYLKDFKKYEHPKHVKDTDILFSDLITLHVQAVYVMTYGDMLEHEGVVSKKFMNKVTSELETLIKQYEKAVRKYMDRIYALDMKYGKKTKKPKKNIAAGKPKTRKKRKKRK